MAYATMTELDAVNQMLVAISEQKVNSLVSTGVLEVDIALETLRNVSREVQAEGWNFNTDHDVTLVPTKDGTIHLPGNYLDVWKVDRSLPRVVPHGSRLYNATARSYTFTAPVVLSMLKCLDFDLMIPSAKNYVAQRACRLFQEAMTGSQVTEEFILRREAQARAALEAADARDAGYNILTDSRLARSAYMRDR